MIDGSLLVTVLIPKDAVKAEQEAGKFIEIVGRIPVDKKWWQWKKYREFPLRVTGLKSGG